MGTEDGVNKLMKEASEEKSREGETMHKSDIESVLVTSTCGVANHTGVVDARWSDNHRVFQVTTLNEEGILQTDHYPTHILMQVRVTSTVEYTDQYRKAKDLKKRAASGRPKR